MCEFLINCVVLRTKCLFLLAFSLSICTAQAQVGLIPAFIDVEAELQAYPTGLIPGVRISFPLGTKSTFHLRGGYNIVRHEDQGVHEDERGGGGGFSLGLDRFLKTTDTGFFVGLRSDLWFNEIDWKDNIGTAEELRGTSRVTVLQPTAELGYLWSFDHGRLLLTPSIAFGYEINIKTEGAPTGEGAILLVGLRLGHRFLVY